MSQTEFHTGKLYPINFGKDLEGYCKRIADKNNIKLGEDWKGDFIDTFNDYSNKKGEVSEEYFIHQENLYRVVDHIESNDDEYFMKLNRTSNGAITFISQFYNGGTCFSEMLEEALEELPPSYQDQIKTVVDNIVELHGVESPITVPGVGKLIKDYISIEYAIELFTGAKNEAAGDVFKSSAYEATLETILKIS
tara:strand:- start:158 stop:739 length:582 start_codon:yes stop_codon:yes gene_type:complete